MNFFRDVFLVIVMLQAVDSFGACIEVDLYDGKKATECITEIIDIESGEIVGTEMDLELPEIKI